MASAFMEAVAAWGMETWQQYSSILFSIGIGDISLV